MAFMLRSGTSCKLETLPRTLVRARPCSSRPPDLQATEPRKAPGKLEHGEGSRKKHEPRLLVLALPCQKFRRTMMRRSHAAAVQCREEEEEEEEEEAMAREAVETAAPTSAPALAVDQETRSSTRLGRGAAATQIEALGEADHETSPNAGNKRKSFDPKSVVIALPCRTRRRGAAPGRAACEASSRARESGWCPSPPDVYKINVHDISFSDDSTGIGLVVRDFKGDFIAAMSRKVKGDSYSGSIDDCAISSGLEFDHDLGLARVFMEGDFAKLSNDCLCSSYLPLYKESVEMYSFCKFGYVEEEANLVAHKLACYAVRLEDCNVWMEDPPDFIEGVLALDTRGIKHVAAG